MNAFWGMDTEQARAHVQALRTGASALQGLTGELEAQVRGVDWTGLDAEQFRSRWDQLRGGLLEPAAHEIESCAGHLRGEVEEQDVVSEQDGTAAGPATPGSTIPAAPGDAIPGALSTDSGASYLHTDNPWLPDWLEKPLEGLASGTAELVSDAIGWGGDLLGDAISGIGTRLGLQMDGFDQFRRDAEHAGGLLTDWATGERVPTYAELVASSALVLGSGGVAAYEMITGEDISLLDDRPGGQVLGVTTDASPQASPQSLQDLIVENNALRMPDPGEGTLSSGQIGIQEVRSAQGSEPSYIVQIPPTEGGGISRFPETWGAQGNSRDWASNIRLVAGQDVAAMQDVRAAMAEAGIPPGSNVMFVGHSQGGIIGDHLAADPSFNNTSGADGSYNITHSFSVGAPVETVVPAQSSTQSVNVSHAVEGRPGNLSGDYIAGLDLGGAQVDGGVLTAPNRHEVSLPGYPVRTSNPIDVLQHNHDSVGPRGETELGYAGSLGRHSATDPTLSALERDLTGTYIGDGTYVARSHVVEVSRGDHP